MEAKLSLKDLKEKSSTLKARKKVTEKEVNKETPRPLKKRKAEAVEPPQQIPNVSLSTKDSKWPRDPQADEVNQSFGDNENSGNEGSMARMKKRVKTVKKAAGQKIATKTHQRVTNSPSSGASTTNTLDGAMKDNVSNEDIQDPSETKAQHGFKASKPVPKHPNIAALKGKAAAPKSKQIPMRKPRSAISLNDNHFKGTADLDKSAFGCPLNSRKSVVVQAQPESPKGSPNSKQSLVQQDKSVCDRKAKAHPTAKRVSNATISSAKAKPISQKEDIGTESGLHHASLQRDSKSPKQSPKVKSNAASEAKATSKSSTKSIASAKQKSNLTISKSVNQKIKDEQLMMKKARRERKLEKFFAEEGNRKKKMEQDPHLDQENLKDACYVHPDDILMPSDECDSDDLSDLDKDELFSGLGGAAREFSSLCDDTYVSTWTCVIAACSYAQTPQWRTIDSEGNQKFQKEICHKLFRRDVRLFVSKMRGMWKWDIDELETILFEEDPAEVWNNSNLAEFTNTEKYIERSGRTHAHIVCEYGGNSGRGTQIRCLKSLQEFLTTKCGWAMFFSTVYDTNSKRPLHYSREKQEIYCMVSQGQKTFVDLVPSCTKNWSPSPRADILQMRELRQQMQRPADRDALISYLKSMKILPDNLESFLSYLRNEIGKHSEMYAVNRAKWRKEYWRFLPARQVKRLCEKMMGNKNWWKQIIHSITAEAANRTANWGMKEFWIEGLRRECTCRRKTTQDGICLKRLRFTCPAVSDEDKEFLGQRKPIEIRKWVLETSNFKLLKLVTKHKVFSEPQYNFIWEFGDQLFKLVSSSVPDIANRLQNIHFCSINGDSGKSGYLNMLCSIFIADDDGKGSEHLCLEISPEAFGTHGMSEVQMFTVVRINEISPGTLWGPLVRLLMEGDPSFKAPLKGDNCAVKKRGATHHPLVLLTSNMPTREEFVKILKTMGPQARWVQQDYDRILLQIM